MRKYCNMYERESSLDIMSGKCQNLYTVHKGRAGGVTEPHNTVQGLGPMRYEYETRVRLKLEN